MVTVATKDAISDFVPMRTYSLVPRPDTTIIGLGTRLVHERVSSLVPRLSGTRIVHAWRAWYIFSRDHDVTKLGPEFLEQKGNLLLIIQPTLRSTLGVYDIRSPIARYK